MKNTPGTPGNYISDKLPPYHFKPLGLLKELGKALASPFRLLDAGRQTAMLQQQIIKNETEIAKLKWELAQKNELVKAIIFYQSHTVRRPLANILGIVEIINHNKASCADMELQQMISLLKTSTDDLDKAIKLNLPIENL
jgi:light-regulated signal transduction histidine kinase (bacteriophytochrome)